MAWLNTSGNTTHSNYVLLSKEASQHTLREEWIPVGYYLNTWQLDEHGNRVLDDDGNEVRVTEWHQTGSIHIVAKVNEVVTIEEWRGVDETTATTLTNGNLGGVSYSDNRTVGRWSSGNAFIDVEQAIGTVVRVSSRRANEAGAWTVTKTTTVTTQA